jgi:DNA-binding NarL/FixJ family response regulator
LKKVRVLLVDDHKVVRAGLRALLESTGRIEVVGEASSGEEGVVEAERLEPDVVVMDLAMPGMGGIRATRQVTALDLDTRVLVLTVHDEEDQLARALDAGAAGYLNKSVADTDLIVAIEALARGHSYLPRRAAALLARRRRSRVRETPGLDALSARERTAIELCASGFTAREAASRMFVSPKTVEGYLARARRKLGLTGRTDIVRFALESGLLHGGEEE